MLPGLFKTAVSTLKNAFTIPTLRYGLPAMMVAAVGLKIALPEAPKSLDSAPPAAAAPAAAPAVLPTVVPTIASAEIAADLPNKPASSVAKAAPHLPDSTLTKAAQASPVKGADAATKNQTVLADSPRAQVWSDAQRKDSPKAAVQGATGKTALGLPADFANQPQAFPAERGHSTIVGELSKADGVFSQIKPAPVKPMMAQAAPLPAAAPAPAPVAMPLVATAAPSPSLAIGANTVVASGTTAWSGIATASGNASVVAGSNSATGLGGSVAGEKKSNEAEKAKRAAPVPMVAPALAAAPAPATILAPAQRVQAKPTLDKPTAAASFISKELRLRWLIALSRELDGRVQESCNTAAPALEQVQYWLGAGANPSYVLNGVSTLALAQSCGFTEAVQAMQQPSAPKQ
jgi:hypothetical protein